MDVLESHNVTKLLVPKLGVKTDDQVDSQTDEEVSSKVDIIYYRRSMHAYKMQCMKIDSISQISVHAPKDYTAHYPARVRKG